MFESLGRVIYRRRRWVVALALAFVAFAGVWGTGVFGAMTGGGFEDPDSDSSRALEAAERELGRDGGDVVVLYRSDGLTVDDPAYADAVTSSLEALPEDGVDAAVTFWSTGAPQLVSDDRRATYAVLTEAGHAAAERGLPVYLDIVQRLFHDFVEDDEAEVLVRVWKRVLDGNGLACGPITHAAEELAARD